MLPLVLAGVAVGVGAPLAALVRRRRLAAKPAPFFFPPPLPEPAPAPAPAPAEFAPPAEPEPTKRDGVLEIVAEGALGFVTGNPLKTAAALGELSGRIVEDVLHQSEGRADFARVVGPLAVPAAAGAALADGLMDKLGIENERVRRTVEQSAAATASGLGFMVPSIVVLQAGSALLHEISPEADEAVRGVFRALDPTATTTVPGKVVGAISDGIQTMFGNGEDVRRRKAEEEARAAEAARRKAEEEARRLAEEEAERKRLQEEQMAAQKKKNEAEARKKALDEEAYREVQAAKAERIAEKVGGSRASKGR